jgi:hypothetical protein
MDAHCSRAGLLEVGVLDTWEHEGGKSACNGTDNDAANDKSDNDFHVHPFLQFLGCEARAASAGNVTDRSVKPFARTSRIGCIRR